MEAEVKEDLVMTMENGAIEGASSAVAISVRDKEAKRKERRRNLIRTTFDGLVVLFLGMQAAQKGPAFLDLQLISGTDVKGTSTYFTANSFGYMAGALMAGFAYDRIGNKFILICFPLSLAAFVIGLTPWCASYITMLLAHMASATQCAIPETTITADQFRIWHGKSEAPFQFLSFMYSLGGVLGPLYTEPFLVPKWNETDSTISQTVDQETNPGANNAFAFKYSALNSNSNAIYNESLGGNRSNLLSNSEAPPESELYYAYLITGIFGILFSIPFYIMSCKNCSKISTGKKLKKKEPEETIPKRLTLKPYLVLSGISSSLLFFYTMTEDSFNMFVSMFVVSHLSWTKENGALLSSLYWGVSTIAKLISVPIVKRIDLGIILMVSCVAMVISLTAFILSSHYGLDIFIWISSSCFAMSQSTMFGGCFSWVDNNILKLDGKGTSTTMISAASGAMVGPFVLGFTMDKISLMTFPYIELINAVLTTCIFMAMYFFLEPYVTKKYGPVRPKVKDMIFSADGNCTQVLTDEKKTMVSDCDSKHDNGDFRLKETDAIISA